MLLLTQPAQAPCEVDFSVFVFAVGFEGSMRVEVLSTMLLVRTQLKNPTEYIFLSSDGILDLSDMPCRLGSKPCSSMGGRCSITRMTRSCYFYFGTV